jgi:hypothetical protein
VIYVGAQKEEAPVAAKHSARGGDRATPKKASKKAEIPAPVGGKVAVRSSKLSRDTYYANEKAPSPRNVLAEAV